MESNNLSRNGKRISTVGEREGREYRQGEVLLWTYVLKHELCTGSNWKQACKYKHKLLKIFSVLFIRVHACDYIPHACCVFRGRRGTLNTLELELQALVSHISSSKLLQNSSSWGAQSVQRADVRSPEHTKKEDWTLSDLKLFAPWKGLFKGQDRSWRQRANIPCHWPKDRVWKRSVIHSSTRERPVI